jgi:zinc transport system ATP-binding protein
VTEATLEVRDLSVGFGDTPVLHNLTFTLQSGASLAIIGPNGAGKSVLLRALLGSIPSQGHIRWSASARIGYVPQKLDIERNLPMTGSDLLRARIALAPQSRVRVDEILDRVGLSPDSAEQLLGTFSGGQFQRLLIAFALLGGPNVLMLDEPTAGVDEPGQDQLELLIHRLHDEQRLTILFISHDLSVVSKDADRVLCLGHHHEYFLGLPTEILKPEILQEAYGMPLRFHVHEH